MSDASTPVPLLDLQAQYARIGEEIAEAVRRVFESGRFVLGAEVERFERHIAETVAVPEAVGVSSGTDALLIALMAEGIGPGDEVITTPFTFFATAGSIARVGARPVFVDIDPVSFNLDPHAVAAALTPRTRAIIPVHLFGQCAAMSPLLDTARRAGAAVIEDAAQAIGARWEGRAAGGLGEYGCFSFFPTKNLGGAGDGGMVTTRDPERGQHLRRLRNHGSEVRYHHIEVGGNFRLDALQAAVLDVKLRHLEAWTEARRHNAAAYREALEAACPPEAVRCPVEVAGARHVYNQFTLRVTRRDELRAALAGRGIATEVYYPIPMHLQPCFEHLGQGAGSLPVAEAAAKEVLSLPIHPELGPAQREAVVSAIAGFYREP